MRILMILLLLAVPVCADCITDHYIDASLLVQSVILTRMDIDSTRDGLLADSHAREGNPLANMWIKDGKYKELFKTVTTLNLSIFTGLSLIEYFLQISHVGDKEGQIATVKAMRRGYLVAWCLMEASAVMTWENASFNVRYDIQF